MTGDYYKWQITVDFQASFISCSYKKSLTNDDVTKKVLKINKVTWATKSKVNMSEFFKPKQYQMILSSVARDKLITFFRYHTKSSFIIFRLRNQKLFTFSFQYLSGKKRISGKSFLDSKTGQGGDCKLGQVLGTTNWEKRDYKIGAASGISNRGKQITHWGRDFKSNQRDFKSRERLEIGARRISNRGRDYRLVQNMCPNGCFHVFSVKRKLIESLTIFLNGFVWHLSIVIPCLLEQMIIYFNVYTKFEVWCKETRGLFSWRGKNRFISL